MTAIKTLKSLAMEAHRNRHPLMPEHARVVHRYTDKTANALTRCVIDWLRYKGHQAERISNTGRPVDTRKRYVDAVGFHREIGSVSWIPGQGTPGTADISATIAGRSVKIEVKIGRDRQSEAQRKYQAAIEAAMGTYIIAKSFDGFLEWYNSFTNKGDNEKGIHKNIPQDQG